MLKNKINATAKFIFVVVAFVALVALNLLVWQKDLRQEDEIRRLQEQLVIQQQKNTRMQNVNNNLRQRIDSLKRGGVEMIEEEARGNFGMVGEGETYFNLDINQKKTAE